MEKFNITNKTKRELAREVKAEIGNNDYTELAIFYKVPTFSNEGSFHTATTFDIDRLQSEGECLYKIFTHHSVDGKLTLEQIENQIFN